MATISATALQGLPEIHSDDDPARLIAASLRGERVSDEDVLVVAHKMISKAEGRTRRLTEVQPGERALALALALGKDPRHVQVVLDETREVRRAERGVLITDSFGRAWRTGQCDVVIGCAGLTALDDWRGRTDIRGRELRATVIAVADQLAGAADLARAKDAMQPAILVRGAGRWVTSDDGPGVAPLIRDPEHDLFR